jgi:hypothetical protein
MIPVPSLELNEEEFKKKAEEASALNSNSDLRKGVRPGSFRMIENCPSFHYAYEFLEDHETLEGEIEKRKEWDSIQVIFLRKDLIAIGKCTNEKEREVLEFIADNFLSGYKLERLKFDEKLLAEIASASPILKVDLKPRSKGSEGIDKLSAIGRGDISTTKFYKDYGNEPLIGVKVELTRTKEEARVGFNKYGTVTISHRNFTDEQFVAVLKEVADKIIAPYIRRINFQQKLG